MQAFLWHSEGSTSTCQYPLARLQGLKNNSNSQESSMHRSDWHIYMTYKSQHKNAYWPKHVFNQNYGCFLFLFFAQWYIFLTKTMDEAHGLWLVSIIPFSGEQITYCCLSEMQLHLFWHLKFHPRNTQMCDIVLPSVNRATDLGVLITQTKCPVFSCGCKSFWPSFCIT